MAGIEGVISFGWGFRGSWNRVFVFEAMLLNLIVRFYFKFWERFDFRRGLFLNVKVRRCLCREAVIGGSSYIRRFFRAFFVCI